MEKKHPIGDLMVSTMQKLRDIMDVNTIVGQPIQADGVTIIPVSKVSMGFASGGSDFTAKNQRAEADNAFGGGSGAGVNIVPVAFLVVKGDSVKLLPVASGGTMVDRVIEVVPEVVDKITEFIEKQQAKKEQDKDIL